MQPWRCRWPDQHSNSSWRHQQRWASLRQHRLPQSCCESSHSCQPAAAGRHPVSCREQWLPAVCRSDMKNISSVIWPWISKFYLKMKTKVLLSGLRGLFRFTWPLSIHSLSFSQNDGDRSLLCRVLCDRHHWQYVRWHRWSPVGCLWNHWQQKRNAGWAIWIHSGALQWPQYELFSLSDHV